MRRIALKVGYDGTAYVGWQRQNNGPSVQQALEEVMERLFHEEVHMMGSGRTDAGVHARGQVAAFDLRHPIETKKLLLALNANLPDDIRVYEVWETASDFHPRFGAKRKTYAYHLFPGDVMPPQYHRYAVLVPKELDWELMRKALSLLEGEHDFIAFRASGGMNLSTVRKIERAVLVPDGEMVRLEVTGNGFLYNMVRIITGTVLEIGAHKLPLDVIPQALATGERELLGSTAPARGLMLMNVEYE